MNTRPVFSRLPQRGYQDNQIADALTDFYDSKLTSVGLQVQSLHTLLDPATAPVEYLDFIAYLVGMVDPYYSVGWAVSVKRKAIAKANDIFSYRGTTKALSDAISIHDFTYDIFSSTDLRFTFTFDGSNTRFGSTTDKVFVRLPLKYTRKGYEFREAQRAVTNYTALVTPTLPCYDKFYFDYSVFGDPLF
jgi:phage tail-like protein